MSASQPPRSPESPEPPRGTDAPTLLVKIFGKDRPGITAGLFDTLAAYAVDVVDIEQVVTRGRIVLCALVTSPEPGTTEGDLRATVHKLGGVPEAAGRDHLGYRRQPSAR